MNRKSVEFASSSGILIKLFSASAVCSTSLRKPLEGITFLPWPWASNQGGYLSYEKDMAVCLCACDSSTGNVATEKEQP